jgi:hypothetical protein
MRTLTYAHVVIKFKTLDFGYDDKGAVDQTLGGRSSR